MIFTVRYSRGVPKGRVGLSQGIMKTLGIQENQMIKIVLTRPKPLVPLGEFKLRAIEKEICEGEVHVNPSLKWKSLKERDKVEILTDIGHRERSFLFP